jgi:hypothetical protein
MIIDMVQMILRRCLSFTNVNENYVRSVFNLVMECFPYLEYERKGLESQGKMGGEALGRLVGLSEMKSYHLFTGVIKSG